jgi:hypothetical protein
MDWVGDKFGIERQEQWYSLTRSDITSISGTSLFNQHGDSYVRALEYVFPEYTWLPWRFEFCPRNFWEDLKNVQNFVEWVAVQLGVHSSDDWYNVSYAQFIALGGKTAITKFGTLYNLLSTLYPGIHSIQLCLKHNDFISSCFDDCKISKKSWFSFCFFDNYPLIINIISRHHANFCTLV